MIICVAGLKGGIGKTTTAVHFAAYLQQLDATLLVDGDPNRSAIAWATRSNSLPFKVVSETQSPRHVPSYKHIVIDTKARPEREDLLELLDLCDLLIIPSPPEFLPLDALLKTLEMLDELKSKKHRVLLTRVPTNSRSTDEQDARELLESQNIPCLQGRIREYAAFKKASLAGCLVHQVKRDQSAKLAWSDYKQVIGEALKEVDNG